MKKITSTSQRGTRIIEAYERSHIRTLDEAYATSYSDAKERAFNDCKELMQSLGGSDMRITGACSNFFSVAFKFIDRETGEKRLAYITHAGDYYLPYDFSTITIEDFERRWGENVTPDIKARTARALEGRVVTSMEEAEGILRMAEGFSAMQRLFGGTK